MIQNKKIFYGILVIIVLATLGIAFYLNNNRSSEKITSFEECEKAGYPVMESHPRQCKTPDGKVFVQEIQQEPESKVLVIYNVTGCEKKTEGKEYTRAKGLSDQIDFEVKEGFLHLTHYLNYVCCAGIKVVVDSTKENPEYTLVKLKEVNEGEICRCICDYEVKSEVGPLKKGKYLFQIWGVEFEGSGGELLWEKEITVEEGSQLANPASVYCIEQKGKLETRKDESGGQYGVCIFEDGTECEEWKFFRGECKKGEIKEGFCGTSTYGNCSADSGCIVSGCSGEICQSKNEEPLYSPCIWKDCFRAEAYGMECKCHEEKCQWIKR